MTAKKRDETLVRFVPLWVYGCYFVGFLAGAVAEARVVFPSSSGFLAGAVVEAKVVFPRVSGFLAGAVAEDSVVFPFSIAIWRSPFFVCFAALS